MCAVKRIAKIEIVDLMPGMGWEVRLRYDPDEAVTVCTNVGSSIIIGNFVDSHRV